MKCLNKEFGQQGYSLIEVLIGLVVLSIALSSAYALTINTRNIATQNNLRTAASNLAEEKLEELRNADYSSLASGYEYGLNSLGNEGSTFNRVWNVETDVPETGLTKATVYVTWPTPGGLSYGSYMLVGLIAE